MGVCPPMAFLPPVKSFDWNNFGLRATSGVIMGTVAIGAVLLFGAPFHHRELFLGLVAVAGVVLSLEWAAMAAPGSRRTLGSWTALAVVGCILSAFAGRYDLAWAVVLLGAVVAALLAKRAQARALDGAYGVLYIAPACLVLVWLVGTLQGSGWTLMLFAATWSADVGAFAAGSVFKGPKLWPRFSPNKTWAGLAGGLAGAILACVGVAAGLMHLSLMGAALIGALGGMATMAGDLWESVLKRRFGVKDSGDLIPGHGGLLDRVDGLMFAVMVFAIARLVVRFGWAH